ncbi:putative galactinol--sucrose galactosyltransferase 1 [Capsicum chinense]|nr:putative galactinol--sucrose galactosyltransferase 1 [Capsicum chinense]
MPFPLTETNQAFHRGYNFLKFGFKISNEVQLYQDDWGKLIITISDYPDHVCRPMIIDAQGSRNPIISYSTEHGIKGYVVANLITPLISKRYIVLKFVIIYLINRDCLFSDLAKDGISLLKIWNLKNFNGVFGVFNCQGAGWCKFGKKNLIYGCQPGTIAGIIRANDVNYLPRIAHDGWTGDAIF